MVRRAIVPGAAGILLSAVVGSVLGGTDAAASAGIGAAVVLANFSAHGLSLAWASRISVTLVQAVALGGLVVRLGAIVGLMFALNALTWFSPLAFGLAVVPGTLLLLVFESRLALHGLGGGLEIPADAVAVRAARALEAREA